MQREFIDFMEDHIGKVRVAMTAEIEAIMEPIGELNCVGEDLGITDARGDVYITTIFYDIFAKCVAVKDETGFVHNVADLGTDDMVAIYEFVYNKEFAN